MRAPQNSFFIFRKFLTSSINYQHECASISNYILINIDLKWVVLIHCHKSFQSVAANNRVTCKSKLYLVACRLMNYSRVGIFYFWMNRETHALSWTKEFFLTFILKYISDQTSPLQMEFSRDIIWIIWEFSCRHGPAA